MLHNVRHEPLNRKRCPVPNRERRRRKNPVTVAIACAFQDGVLFCADTKITTGQQKAHESKIYIWPRDQPFNNRCAIFIVAGDTDYAAAAIEKCERAIAKLDFSSTSLGEFQDSIEAVLVDFYQTHIFPHPDRLLVGFDLLIGLWLNHEIRVLATRDTALRIVHGYECVGAGGYLARFWLREALGAESQFKPEHLTLEEASLVVEHAINNAVEYDESCGYDSAEPYATGEAEYIGLKTNGDVGPIQEHAHLRSFPKQLQSATWRLLKVLAKAKSVSESENAVEEFCETVQRAHEPLMEFQVSLDQLTESRGNDSQESEES